MHFLQELPKTLTKAKGGEGWARLAAALFDRIDVLGIREATSISARTRSAMVWRRAAG